jgi:histidine triad (HIT) family protein
VNEHCIFCRIARGQIPSTLVAESERVMAIEDINPAAPKHVVLFPKEHAADSLGDLTDPTLAGEIVGLAQMIASEPSYQDGWRLVVNVGTGGGQTVFHLHVHLLGGRQFTWPPG